MRRPFSLPIILAAVMLALLVVLTAGWVLLNVVGALVNTQFAGMYWTFLSIGTAFIVLLVVGVIMYLSVSVAAINLSRRQANFVDSVTHELKSPIASLKLYLQTLGRRQVDAEAQTDFHRSMLEEVERLDRLINHVLDARRLEAGAADGEAEDVPLGPLLGQCAEMACLCYRVPAESVRLEVAPQCAARGRRLDLDLVFRNLIDNAVKYAGEPPRVEVTARVESGRVVVRVGDNGHGIPPKLRRKVFGRFVRLGLELERQKPGTGLGLYIVREAVGRLGGSIRVDASPGGGALFEVRLPPGASPALLVGRKGVG